MNDLHFEEGDHFFVSFDHDNPMFIASYTEQLIRISKIISEQLDYKHREMGIKEPALGGMGRRFFEAVELKWGIPGFKIDLKKLLQRI